MFPRGGLAPVRSISRSSRSCAGSTGSVLAPRMASSLTSAASLRPGSSLDAPLRARESSGSSVTAILRNFVGMGPVYHRQCHTPALCAIMSVMSTCNGRSWLWSSTVRNRALSGFVAIQDLSPEIQSPVRTPGSVNAISALDRALVDIAELVPVPVDESSPNRDRVSGSVGGDAETCPG